SGGLAVGVPGALRGYRALLDRFGTTLGWSELFEDAIGLARNGFRLGFYQADALKHIESGVYGNENMRKVYWNSCTNTTYREGETLVQEDLADTLEEIAKHGVDYFYTGGFARGMVEEIQKQKGIMTAEDLGSYKVVWNHTTTATFSDGRVMHSVPPPGSGPVLAQIMGILDGYRDNATGLLADNSLTMHRFVESCKFAYAKRSLLGDSAFVDVTKVSTNYFLTCHRDRRPHELRTLCVYRPSFFPSLGVLSKNAPLSRLVMIASSSSSLTVFSTLSRVEISRVRRAFRRMKLTFTHALNQFLWKISAIATKEVLPPSLSRLPRRFTRLSLACRKMADRELPVATPAVRPETFRKLVTGILKSAMSVIETMDAERRFQSTEVRGKEQALQATIRDLERKGHKVVVSSGPFNFLEGIRRQGGRIYANVDYRKGGSPDGD
ncbi:unnamed protein product, partial [Ixodes hexagonus]